MSKKRSRGLKRPSSSIAFHPSRNNGMGAGVWGWGIWLLGSQAEVAFARSLGSR